MEISMILLGVENIARSIEFYRDTLALKLTSQAGEFAFFSAGGVTLILSGSRAGATEVIFPTESVAASLAELTHRGCRFINEPREVTPGSWAATFVDPDGHRLTLFGKK